MKHRKWIKCLFIAGGALGLLPATAVAQADTARWQGIPVHARVRIMTPGAREIRGTLVGWTDSSLTIRTPPEVMIGLHQIERLRVARGNHLGKGLWIGASAGAVIGSVIGLFPPKGDFSRGSIVLFGGALGTFSGGVIGGIAGALATRWEDVRVPQ